MLAELFGQWWRAFLEVLLLWLLTYQVFRVLRSTRGGKILVGFVALALALVFASRALDLRVIAWMLESVAPIMAVLLLILFQPEIRSTLARLGSTRFFSLATSEQQEFLEQFGDGVISLSRKRFGALFAIERSIALDEFSDSGVPLDATVSTELLMTIFYPKTSLHDGGVVVFQERLESAACLFPVSQKELTDRSLGLRHRAGLGITEATDAVAIVVSEETGSISICVDGQIEHNLEDDAFRTRLQELFFSDGTTKQQPPDETPLLENSLSSGSDRDVVSH